MLSIEVLIQKKSGIEETVKGVEEKMDQRREKIYIGVIVALLILTFYTSTNRSNDFQQIENSIHNMRSSMSGEISRIEQQVNRIQEEERWWRKRSMDLEMMGEDRQRVTTEWQLRDYNEGEMVYFHYRLPGEENYQRIEMQEIETGLYRGTFEIEIAIEPLINIHYSGSTAGPGNEAVEFRHQDEGEPEFMSYYLSTENEGHRRTTMEESLYFSNLRYELYPPVHMDIHYRGGNQPGYSLHLHMDHYYMDSRHALESMEIFLVNQGQQVREVELESQEESLYYHKNIALEDEDFDEIFIRFIYDNNQAFERRVKIDED